MKVFTNPLTVQQQQETPVYIVKKRLPAPLCCITADSDHTKVTEESVGFRHNTTYCELGVESGAGYEITLQRLSNITRFGTSARKLCCLFSCGHGWAAVRPTGHVSTAPINGDPNLLDYFTRLWAFVPRAQGPLLAPPPPLDGAPAFGVTSRARHCGCASRSLKVHSNGLLLLEDVEQGPCVRQEEKEAATLADFNFVKYSTAPFLQRCCCGAPNGVEVSFLHDKYALAADGDTPAMLEDFHKGLLTAQLGGRLPSAPLKTIPGANGASVIIGPEFTTVAVKGCTWGGEHLTTTQTTTVRTKDVSYLQAKLPSWINALVKAVRDFEMYKLAKNCNMCWTTDLAALPVWPCGFGFRSWVVLGLLLKALTSFLAFLFVFFCRATTLVLGGPGPGMGVLLTIAEKDPEALLQDVAATVARAQQVEAGAPPPPQAAVATTAPAADVGLPKWAPLAWQPHAAAHRPAGKLPAGWTECVTDDGHTYYDFAANGHTQWERPTY